MADDKKEAKPAIIVKKGGHGGHHGGAWKIAYADFTTAMMCFFLCMWLINTASVTTRQAIASYFRKPSIFQEGSGQPLLLGGQGILSDAYVPPREKDPRKMKDPIEDQKTHGETTKDLDKLYIQEAKIEPKKHKGPTEVTGLNSQNKQIEESRKEIKLRIIAQETQRQIERLTNTAAATAKELGKLEMKVEPDGLKIEIMDTDKYSMFDSGSAKIRKDAEPAFRQITEIIRRYPNTLEVYGHTDSQPFPSRTGGYTNWELSADRANAARRLIESQGYQSDKIQSVIGKASTELRNPANPTEPSNRRITLKLKFDLSSDLLKRETPEPLSTDPLKELLFSKEAQQQLAEPTPAKPVESPAAERPAATEAEAPTAPDITPLAKGSPKVRLPDEALPTGNPDYMPENKVFGDSPVLGARDLFSTR
jgi:chemotaxis protein MotB